MQNMTEKQLVNSYSEIHRVWVKNLNDLKNNTVHPKYFSRLAEIIAYEFDFVGKDLLKCKSISFEGKLKIRTMILEIYGELLIARAISGSKWMDKHGNFLDRFIGVRDIKMPAINMGLK